MFIKTTENTLGQLCFWNIYFETTQPLVVSLQHDADVSLPADNTAALENKLRRFGLIALL